MDRKSKVAFEHVNLTDKVNDDPVATRVPRATMITITTADRGADGWSKARVTDFNRKMNER